MNTTSPAPARVAAALFALTLMIGACAAAGGPAWTYAPLGPTPAATVTPGQTAGQSPGETPGENVIDIEMTADLRILSNGQHIHELRLATGATYTFRVTNTAGFVHDFYLGPPDRLSSGDTAGLPGVDEFTEGTREFEWTATEEGAQWEFACTVLGHYGPMHGSLVLEGE